ncbi:MAG: phosphodiesterase [Eubacteriales bacterium]|nr:phosphodiesterase [Eubacteriales bacterium]
MKKILIASDIHGSAYYCRKLLERIQAEQPDRIVLLGDLLYHGPRNDLPAAYDPKQVIDMLDSVKSKLLCVRGNCDAEVDQLVLDFPIMADYAVLVLGEQTVYATHGHVYGEQNPPPHCAGDILLCGHTHVPCRHVHDDFVYINPGSVAIPKEGSPHSYMLWEDSHFTWHDLLTGNAYQPQ